MKMSHFNWPFFNLAMFDAAISYTLQDIAAKILSFSQQRPRAVCVLSGSGTVSLVTFKHPSSSNGNITYEVEALQYPNVFILSFLFIPICNMKSKTLI